MYCGGWININDISTIARKIFYINGVNKRNKEKSQIKRTSGARAFQL